MVEDEIVEKTTFIEEVFIMEKGILFSEIGRPSREYEKSFCFAETPRSSYWDEEEPNAEVTREEAQRYDAIMEQIIAADFF